MWGRSQMHQNYYQMQSHHKCLWNPQVSTFRQCTPVGFCEDYRDIDKLWIVKGTWCNTLNGGGTIKIQYNYHWHRGIWGGKCCEFCTKFLKECHSGYFHREFFNGEMKKGNKKLDKICCGTGPTCKLVWYPSIW